MPVDVRTEIVIARPVEEVAAFAADPRQRHGWYRNIEAVDLETAPPLAVGSRMAFRASFLNCHLAYTYEVVEYEPGARLVMRTADGPFPMEMTYTWEPASGGGTRMTVRNRGEPRGFSRLASPFVTRTMRRATRQDLKRLMQILEQ
jgi:uncharacterized protein YndB with AHSA1/START domain